MPFLSQEEIGSVEWLAEPPKVLTPEQLNSVEVIAPPLAAAKQEDPEYTAFINTPREQMIQGVRDGRWSEAQVLSFAQRLRDEGKLTANKDLPDSIYDSIADALHATYADGWKLKDIGKAALNTPGAVIKAGVGVAKTGATSVVGLADILSQNVLGGDEEDEARAAKRSKSLATGFGIGASVLPNMIGQASDKLSRIAGSITGNVSGKLKSKALSGGDSEMPAEPETTLEDPLPISPYAPPDERRARLKAMQNQEFSSRLQQPGFLKPYSDFSKEDRREFFEEKLATTEEQQRAAAGSDFWGRKGGDESTPVDPGIVDAAAETAGLASFGAGFPLVGGAARGLVSAAVKTIPTTRRVIEAGADLANVGRAAKQGAEAAKISGDYAAMGMPVPKIASENVRRALGDATTVGTVKTAQDLSAKSMAAVEGSASSRAVVGAMDKAGKATDAVTGAIKKVTDKIPKQVTNPIPTLVGLSGHLAAGSKDFLGGLFGMAGKTAPVVAPLLGAALTAPMGVYGAFGGFLGGIATAGIFRKQGPLAAAGLAKSAAKDRATANALMTWSTKEMGPWSRAIFDASNGIKDISKNAIIGAATLDLPLAIASSETSEDIQNQPLFGAALRSLHAVPGVSRRMIVGQLLDPKNTPLNQEMIGRAETRVGSSQFLDAAHDARVATLTPEQKNRLGGIRWLASQVGAEAYLVERADVKMELDRLAKERNNGVLTPEQEAANELASQQGGMFFGVGREITKTNHRGEAVTRSVPTIFVIEPGTAAHETKHAFQKVLGDKANEQIAQLLRKQYDSVWEDVGAYYAGRMFGDAKVRAAMSAGKDWRDLLAEAQITDRPDFYIANEIAADLFSSLFAHTGPSLLKDNSLPGKLARIVAKTTAAFGGNPFEGEVTDNLGLPVDYKSYEAQRKAAQDALKIGPQDNVVRIEPGPPEGPVLPKNVTPTIIPPDRSGTVILPREGMAPPPIPGEAPPPAPPSIPKDKTPTLAPPDAVDMTVKPREGTPRPAPRKPTLEELREQMGLPKPVVQEKGQPAAEPTESAETGTGPAPTGILVPPPDLGGSAAPTAKEAGTPKQGTAVPAPDLTTKTPVTASEARKTIEDAVASGVRTFKVDYRSVRQPQTNERGAARAAREAAYEAERQAMVDGLPADVRERVDKVHTHLRFERNGEQSLGYSMDRFLVNADRISKMLWEAKRTDLSPYPIDPATGRITPDGIRQLLADQQAYAYNHSGGMRGDGRGPITVPEAGFLGYTPEQLNVSEVTNRTKPPANFKPKVLPAAAEGRPSRSDFINLLYGEEYGPPKGTKSNRGQNLAPANVMAQAVSRASQLEGEADRVSIVKPSRGVFEGPSGARTEVVDTNPLRPKLDEIRTSMQGNPRELLDVVERIKVTEIQGIEARPDINFPAVNTDAVRAGYSPRANGKKFSPSMEREARDNEYAAAVAKGDYDTAQKIVDEAAKMAGFDTKAYHRTNAKFTEFDPEKIGSQTDSGFLGRGFYFTTDPGPRPKFAYQVDAFLNLGSAKYISMPDWKTDKRTLVGDISNYDSVVLDYTPAGYLHQEIMVKSPRQIKSADAVTYDDAGNVIPPSQRFNSASPDIRFSPMAVKRDAAPKPKAGLKANDPRLGLGLKRTAPAGVDPIELAAVKWPDGRVTVGPMHPMIRGEENARTGEERAWRIGKDGFVTKSGKFLDRDEAEEHALKIGQIKRQMDGLESIAFARAREFSPKAEKRDADYLKAVESGDTKTAQTLVNAAIDDAGYNVSSFKGYYPKDWETGKPLTVIARPSEFPAFNKGEPGVKIAGFFAESKPVAERFAKGISKEGIVDAFALKLERPFVIDAKGDRAGNLQFHATGKPFRDAIRSGKYDSVIIKDTSDEGTIFVTLSPEQSKLMDTVTRDDAGNVIPLSQRFNAASPDIRYSPKAELVKPKSKKKKRRVGAARTDDQDD